MGPQKTEALKWKNKIIQKQKFSNSIKTLQLIKFLAVKFQPEIIFWKFQWRLSLFDQAKSTWICSKKLEYSHLGSYVLKNLMEKNCKISFKDSRSKDTNIFNQKSPKKISTYYPCNDWCQIFSISINRSETKDVTE